MAENEEVLKVTIMGGGGVGKSNLTIRLTSGGFKDYYDPTIEDSYKQPNFMCDGEVTPIEILDTAGQDTFLGLRDVYYRTTDGFVFVYSIIDRGSLADVEDRFSCVKNVRDPDDTGVLPPIILVGNKSDLEDQRVISEDEGKKLAAKYGSNVLFTEASAKANINVNEVFEDVVREIKKVKATEIKESPKDVKKGCCCILL